jgi:peptide/nickel transport system substrate-binding protein
MAILIIFHKCNAPQDHGLLQGRVDNCSTRARTSVRTRRERKAIYEKLTKPFSRTSPSSTYHRRILIAHTTKLDGYKQMPDGLVRVVGLSLK